MKHHRFGDGGVNPRYPDVFESVFAQPARQMAIRRLASDSPQRIHLEQKAS
jgi:hypothetical protein